MVSFCEINHFQRQARPINSFSTKTAYRNRLPWKHNRLHQNHPMKKQMIVLLTAGFALSPFAADPSPSASAIAAPSAQTSQNASNTGRPVSGDKVGDV